MQNRANVGYIYYLILPASSKIQIIRGDLCKKKSDAKKLVAFICCKLLFENGCLNSDLKPSSFNHYGLCSKNDEEEIREEDEEYRLKLEKLVVTHRKIKRNNEEICNNYYPSFTENQLSGPFHRLALNSEFFIEVHIYEICFSSDFQRFLPEIPNMKFGLIHQNSNLHEVYFKICPEFTLLPERTVQLLCRRKVFLKEHEYYDLLLQHFFIGLAINNNDVRFFEMLTGEKIKNSFVFNFKGKNYCSYNFSSSFNKQMSLFTFLKKDNSIDFDLTKKIKKYATFMGEFYKVINENAFAKPERIKLPLNNDFIRLLRENQPVDDLVLQSITNLQKYVIFDMKKIRFIDLRKLKIGKYNMLERRGFLEKKLNCTLGENDYVIYCTSLYRDYMKNLKSYVFKEKERSLTYALPIELVIFPLGFKALLWCQFLPFIWQKLQNLMMFQKVKENLLIPKEYCCFLKNQISTPWVYNVPFSLNLILYDTIVKYFKINKIDYFDLEKTRKETKIAILRKTKIFAQIAKLKRGRDEDELLVEYGINPIKKVNSSPFVCLQDQKKNLSLNDDFLKIKLTTNDKFNSFSLNLNVKDIQTALTFRTYEFSDSYERLEFFGDSILKFLATLEVFFEYPSESEGFLSKKRSKIVSNSFLKKACIKNEIYPYILMTGKPWVPNGLSPEYTTNFQEVSEESLIFKGYTAIPNKTLADVIESLTALYYLKNNNVEASQVFLNMVGVLKEYKLNYKVVNGDENLLKNMNFSGNLLIEKFSMLEEILGYKFQNINLLIQAFTHISFRQTINNVLYFQFNEKNFFLQHENSTENELSSLENDYYLNVNFSDVEAFNEKVDKNSALINKLNPSEFSYDRLEFLGDSIFDFLVENRLYNNMKDEDPNGLSLMKAAVVNNHVLSLIALYYKFNNFILFDNKLLKSKIDIFAEKVETYLENSKLYFSENESCVKVLADVFESMIGAVYIDTGLDIKKTEEIVMKLAEKFINRFASKDFANTSPLNGLKKYCEEKKLGTPKIK